MSWDYYRERIRQLAEAMARSLASSHAGTASVLLNSKGNGVPVQIGEGSSMTNCTVLCPLRVGKNTHLSSCVIGSNDGKGDVTIGDGCEIHGAALSGVVEILDGSRVFDSGLQGVGTKKLGEASTLVASSIICNDTRSHDLSTAFLSGKGLVLVHSEVCVSRGSVTVGADAVAARVSVNASTWHGIVIGDRVLFAFPGASSGGMYELMPEPAPVSGISFTALGRRPLEIGSDVSILGPIRLEVGALRVSDGATMLNGEERGSAPTNTAVVCMRIKSLDMGRQSMLIFGRNDWYRLQAMEVKLGGRSRLIVLHCPPDRRSSLSVPYGETMVI